MIVVLLLACGTPSQGEAGPAGPAGADGHDGVDGLPGQDGAAGADGAPGRDGVNAASFRWVDVDGNEVGADLVYIDGNGMVWTIDPETGEVEEPADVAVYYTSEDCAGRAYVPLVRPLTPFRVDGEWHARYMDAASEEVFPSSYATVDGCHNYSPTAGATLVRLDYCAVSNAPPVLGFRAPLRMAE